MVSTISQSTFRQFRAAGIVAGIFLLIIACSRSLSPNEEQEEQKGGQTIDLPPPYSHVDILPSPRPNTTEVAFIKRLGEKAPDDLKPGIYLVDRFTKKSQMLLEGSFGRSDWLDRDRIIYSNLDSNSCVFLYHFGNNTIIKINDHSGINISAEPSGRIFIYEHGSEIWKFNLITNERSLIISGGLRRPALSPDGTSILFSRRANSGYSRVISQVTSDGEYLGDITDTITGNDDDWPQWNNEGNQIVYESYNLYENYLHIIFLIDLSSVNPSDIAIGHYPILDNNSEGIFYSNWINNTGEMRIFYHNISTGESEKITY